MREPELILASICGGAELCAACGCWPAARKADNSARTIKVRAIEVVTFTLGAKRFSQSTPQQSRRHQAGNCTRDVGSITHARNRSSHRRTTTCEAESSAHAACTPCSRETLRED